MTVLFKGIIVTLVGSFIAPGTKAPDFNLVKNDLSEYTLNENKGKYVVLNIFPSLDTGVCAMSVRRFNQMASEQHRFLKPHGAKVQHRYSGCQVFR